MHSFVEIEQVRFLEVTIVDFHRSVRAVTAFGKLWYVLDVSALPGVWVGGSCCSRESRDRPADTARSLPGIMDIAADRKQAE